MNEYCVFCAIMRGQAPASFVYKDSLVTAFMDNQPINPGHLLVVPTRHVASLLDLDGAIVSRMAIVAKQAAAALRRSGVRFEGFNLWLADGDAAGQEVAHAHLHVLPRFPGDGFGLKKGPDYGFRPSQAELARVAQTIRRVAGWNAE